MLKSKLLPEDKNKVGCYIIQDPNTLATYVGSGVLGDRYYKHKLALERGRINEDICTCGNTRGRCKCRHFNPNLQKVYNNNPDQLELLHMVIDNPGLTRIENRANASQMEQLIIDKLEGNPLLLNIAKDTLAPRFGAIVSEDTKLKQSSAQQKRFNNRTDEEKIIDSAKAIISNYSKQGINLSLDDAIQRLEENKARKIEEDKRRIFKEQQRIAKTNELEQIRLARLDYKNSEEYKEARFKIRSETIKKKWEDPDFRKTRSEIAKKQWEDPDFRKTRSEIAKKQWEDPDFRNKTLSTLHNANKKKVTINSVQYESITEAKKTLNINENKIRNFINI